MEFAQAKVQNQAAASREEKLKDLAAAYDSYVELKGNAHVLLFAGWAKPDRSRLLAYETGAPPMMKVLLNDMGTEWLLAKGYTAWRYRGMREKE